MKSRLGEIGEVLIGATWWGATYVWGALVGAMLVLAPLLMANLIAEIADGIPATVALGAGVAAAYAIGFHPWDGESRVSLLLAVVGAAASVVLWQLLRGSADSGTFAVAIGAAVAGWPIRRAADSLFGQPTA